MPFLLAKLNCVSVQIWSRVDDLNAFIVLYPTPLNHRFTQLIDAKIPWVILGHTERRSLFHEDSELVGEKTGVALAANLSVIACTGESLSEREADKTLQVVKSQLDGIKKGLAKHGQSWDRIVVAYDPVWATRTGKMPTPQQAQEVHKAIREWFKKNVDAQTSDSIRIIYGGSVNSKNCEELGYTFSLGTK